MTTQTVLLLKPGEPAQPFDVATNLESHQALVGGYLERLPFEGFDLWINEEGKYSDTKPCLWHPDFAAVFGPCYLAKADGRGRTIGLEPAELDKLKRLVEPLRLRDLSEWAPEYGIKVPLYMTEAAWKQTIEVSPVAAAYGQDVRGRAHDVLYLGSNAMRATRGAVTTWQVHVNDGPAPNQQHLRRLKAIMGPGLQEEPCITILPA